MMTARHFFRDSASFRKVTAFLPLIVCSAHPAAAQEDVSKLVDGLGGGDAGYWEVVDGSLAMGDVARFYVCTEKGERVAFSREDERSGLISNVNNPSNACNFTWTTTPGNSALNINSGQGSGDGAFELTPIFAIQDIRGSDGYCARAVGEGGYDLEWIVTVDIGARGGQPSNQTFFRCLSWRDDASLR